MLVTETLLRYMGFSEDLIREKQRDCKNPFVWFREGVAAVLLLPVQLLQSLGLLPAAGVASISHSWIFRLLTGLVTLIGLLASCIELVLGSELAVASVRKFVGF